MFLAAADAQLVRRVLFLHGLGAADIDDVMQEIELRALQQRPRGSRRAWACVVATNLAMDRHRRRKRFADPTLVADAASPADEAAGVVLREVMRAGLNELPVELRATVVLRFYADFAVAEIATAMDVPQGTVKSRLHRAMTLLRSALPQEVTR